MITCYVRYVIDPHKIAEFERYAEQWLDIVQRLGGTHHGYFLPGEGASNIALCLFSFTSLAAYENYRMKLTSDPDAIAAINQAEKYRFIHSYERTFLRPLLPGRGAGMLTDAVRDS